MISANEKLEDLNRRRKKIEEAGGTRRVEKQHASGKMTSRERLEYFFDEGTFLEVDAFVQSREMSINVGIDEVYSESVIVGYGKVGGRTVCAFSQDFTISGGSLGEMHAKKICKIMDLAVKIGAPVVGLNDSGGARIQEGVESLTAYGNIFFKNVRSSGVIPQISAIMGPCAGGAVYSPALTDFVFMVEKTSQMFITGPQVIKTVTGEIIDQEQLGGAMTHNSVSGCAQFMFDSDKECLDQIKKLISFLPSNNTEKALEMEYTGDLNEVFPSLNEIIPDNPNKSYDMFELIKVLVDNGDYMEYLPHFAKNIITCFARINGRTVGIIANQPTVMAGCLNIDAGDKSSKFIRTCDSFNIPLLTIVDVPGFLPGVNQEHGGIIRHGAKMLYAYSEATVPTVTLITRKCYGGACLAMAASKSVGIDMIFAWPTAEIAVMGAEGAVSIMYRNEIKNAENPKDKNKELLDNYKKEFSNPYQAAKNGLVDDVIDPSTSRQRIIDAFNMLEGKRDKLPAKKHGNIPL